MPPVLLGAILTTAFVLAFIVRRPIERLFVISSSDDLQPNRQFFTDIAIYLVVGFAVILCNKVFFDFPLIISGGKLFLGCVVIGFFSSLDMALARERAVIQRALTQDEVLSPPTHLYSMTRKFSLIAITATLFVAIIIVLIFSRDIVWLSKIEQSVIAMAKAQRSVIIEIFFIMSILLGMVVNLIISYSINLKLLFDSETHILERVSRGDLSKLVPVATRDEFGVIAGHTNTMIHGLRDRIKLITALKLAEELQHNLLPQSPPIHPGLDIAGTSIYCDQTGGDYYDYLELPGNRLGVVVADASDHGVGAALHMTTARAFLHFGLQYFSGPAGLLQDVNHFLTKDSLETGRFMSMFFLEIDTSAKILRWVRAGHEPAMLYHPDQSRFQELTGEGMALGVVDDLSFREYTQHGWNSGSVLIIGTDGIREMRNKEGKMFGLNRLQDVVQKHAATSAESIKNAAINALKDFQDDAPQEDDITLVVIKLL